MNILLGILLTLVVFTFIVFIHEMGHFLAARFTKMKVEEFGIGIPPKAKTLGKDKKGTEYTLNWLPIGGFVRIKGEDPGSDEANAKDSFASKKWWARALVLVAGVMMNFLLAIVIFFIFFLSGASPIGPNLMLDKDYGSYFLPSFEKSVKSGYIEHGGIRIDPLSGSVAMKGGIISGDILRSMDGEDIKDIDSFRSRIKEGKPRIFIVSGTGGERSIALNPENGKIGAYLSYKDLKLNKDYSQKFGIIDAFLRSFRETYGLSHMTLDVLGGTLRKLISPATPTERKEATDMLSGPIGIGSTFVDVVSIGVTWKIIFSIIALLSINLGVLNILPFPALDGGRLLSTTLRSIVGWCTHKTSLLNSIEYVVHAFGMLILLALSFLIAILDVWKLF